VAGEVAARLEAEFHDVATRRLPPPPP